MDKNPLSDNRQIPMDNAGLQAMLAGGPSTISSTVSGEVPPLPDTNVQPSVEEQASPSDPSPVVDEGPADDMKNQMILPSEQEKVALRARFGTLRVVPIPYTRGDGKIQTYILRSLTRSQWRTMEDGAKKIAEAKPNMTAEDIFQEKIVSTACVWPDLPEHKIATLPPGLVPTLFGIVQQMGLFFNPEAIMSVTYIL